MHVVEGLRGELESLEKLLSSPGYGVAALSTFARDLAHEINSPLAAAMSEIGYVVTRRGSEADRDKAVAAALESLVKVRRIIERVQRLGEQVDTTGACPIDLVVRAAVDPLRPLVSLRGARIELDLHTTRPIEHGARLAPVITELVTNASRAVSAGGRIGVRLRQLTRHALLIVRDDGCGMTDEQRRRAFQPSPGGNGNAGLGLPLCHSVISSLGGTIDVDSTPGAGTEVVISIPVA